jgi:hypothetical protein
MNSLLLIYPDRGSGFQPILSGKQAQISRPISVDSRPKYMTNLASSLVSISLAHPLRRGDWSDRQSSSTRGG